MANRLFSRSSRLTQVFVVFRVIVSNEYESKFLAASNQKAVLMKLSTKRLITCGAVLGECTCGTSMLTLAEMSLSSTCNVLLNNYCKRAATVITRLLYRGAAHKRSSGKQKGKRKAIYPNEISFPLNYWLSSFMHSNTVSTPLHLVSTNLVNLGAF